MKLLNLCALPGRTVAPFNSVVFEQSTMFSQSDLVAIYVEIVGYSGKNHFAAVGWDIRGPPGPPLAEIS